MIDVRPLVLVVALAGITVASSLAVEGRAPAAERDGRYVAAAANRTGPVRPPHATSDLAPPARVSATAAPEEPRYGPVDTVRPSIRIRDVPAEDVIGRIRTTSGVAVASVVRIGSVRLGGTSEVRIAAVDPVTFRALTPQPTADTIGVWERLEDGEAAFSHEQARTHELELGGHVQLGSSGGGAIRVGAFASNGTPPVADAIVDLGTGSRLGLDRVAPTVLVGATAGVDVASLAERLREVTDATVEVIPDPRAPAPVSAEQQRGAATVWDALAMCESSGDWHINSGNGFYGGLQFLPESWWMVGGTGMPHEASREEQIHRAELLLRIQGWEAWPVCSVRLGLRPPPPGWEGSAG